MLVGYVRVSNAAGSQTTDLQRDAMVAAGLAPSGCMRTAPPAPRMTGLSCPPA